MKLILPLQSEALRLFIRSFNLIGPELFSGQVPLLTLFVHCQFPSNPVWSSKSSSSSVLNLGFLYRVVNLGHLVKVLYFYFKKEALKACLQWKVHLAYPASLQALHSITQKQIIQIQHNRVKNPNCQEAASWLFTSVTEDLNSRQPRRNPANGQSGTRTRDRRIARRANHSTTWPPCHRVSLYCLNTVYHDENLIMYNNVSFSFQSYI